MNGSQNSKARRETPLSYITYLQKAACVHRESGAINRHISQALINHYAICVHCTDEIVADKYLQLFVDANQIFA